MVREQLREVGVLGQHDGVRLACGLEDGEILGVAQAQIADGVGGKVEGVGDPLRQGRRELSINPDRHAASTG